MSIVTAHAEPLAASRGHAGLDDLVAGFRAAGDPTRLRLLALCARGEWTVSELIQCLGLSQPVVSRHLRLLCEAGLLERRQEGAWVFLRLARDGAAGRLARGLAEALPRGQHPFSRDEERLEAIRRARADSAAAFFRDLAVKWDRIRILHVGDATVERELLRLLPPAAIRDLLDIGTGTGRIVELFGAAGVRAVGLDLSREMLSVARANLARAGLSECYVRHGDLYDLPWPEPAFDAVTIHHVLHYCDAPERAIAEAARVLRPGGRLAIADFAPHQYDALRREHAHRRLGFADAELRSWLEAAGLEPGETVALPGAPLTICLWHARKPAPAQGNRLP